MIYWNWETNDHQHIIKLSCFPSAFNPFFSQTLFSRFKKFPFSLHKHLAKLHKLINGRFPQSSIFFVWTGIQKFSIQDLMSQLPGIRERERESRWQLTSHAGICSIKWTHFLRWRPDSIRWVMKYLFQFFSSKYENYLLITDFRSSVKTFPFSSFWTPVSTIESYLKSYEHCIVRELVS